MLGSQQPHTVVLVRVSSVIREGSKQVSLQHSSVSSDFAAMPKQVTRTTDHHSLCVVCTAAGVLASDLGKDYVRCNSLAYWGIVLSAVPLTLVITLAVRAHLVR